jgi:mycothiol synthase
MNLNGRPYQCEADYWQIRGFLRHTFQLNGRREWNWQPFRFDYWRWHVNENIHHLNLADAIFIWETAEGGIAAVLHPEDAGEAHCQIHPAWRTPELLAEMVATAEQHLAVQGADGRRRLRVWANEHNHLLQAVLARRAYSKGEWPEYQRRRPLTIPIDDTPVAAGYTVRSLGDTAELPARSYLSWQAFHPDEPDERYEGWEWYLNVQRAPLYRRDLDLVAVAPDGALAAFCTVWFDDATRTGAFEPVGTAPAHQRRGLGTAVMREGLRRLQRLGATLATVGSYSAGAGALYASLGFTGYDLSERWEKVW